MSIEQFLSQSRSEGQLDSVGGFCLDRFAALRKTLYSALPNPLYYLLQLGQGLVALGGQNISWSFGTQDSRIRFELETERLGDFQGLADHLTSDHITLASPEGRDLLLTGIAAALVADKASAELRNLTEGTKLCFDEDGVRVEPHNDEPGPGFELIMHRLSPQDEAFSWSRFWHGYEYEQLLIERFQMAPESFRVGGMSAGPLMSWSTDLDSVGELGPLVLVEAAVIPDSSMAANHRGYPGEKEIDSSPVSVGLFRTSGDWSEWSKDFRGLPILGRMAADVSGEPQDAPLSSVDWQRRLWTFLWTSQPEGKSVVEFVRYGCLLERRQVEWGIPGLRVFAPADDLKVDASGFSLVQDVQFQERLVRTEELARKLTARLTQEAVSKLVQGLPRKRFTHRDLDETFPWLG